MKGNANVREELIVPDHMTSLSAVNIGITIFSDNSNAMLASTVKEKRPIATNGALYMYKVFKDGDVKRLVEKMNGEKVLNFAYHNAARLDYFMSKICKGFKCLQHRCCNCDRQHSRHQVTGLQKGSDMPLRLLQRYHQICEWWH